MLAEFNQAVVDLVNKMINEIHTACPGKIVSYDANTGLATVLPQMKFKKPNGDVLDYPQITGVPVLIPQGFSQDAVIAYPVKAGDGCLIIVAENSIDFWLYGQQTDTDLHFDLTNAICIPGLFAAANKAVKEAIENNAVVVDVKGTKITVKQNDVKITSPKVTITGDLVVNGKTKTASAEITGNLDVGGKAKAGSEEVTGALSVGGTATMKAGAVNEGLTVGGAAAVTGNITSGGTVTADTDVVGGGVSLVSHTHS